jgi:hypothetical protein
MAAEDTLRLEATVIDKFSRPIQDMQRSLRLLTENNRRTNLTDAEWSNFSKRLQASGMGTPEGKRSQTPYQGDPTDPAFDKDKWLPYKKTPWSPGLHAIDPHKEQEASLHGDLLGAAHKAGMFSHKVTGEATVRVALDQGLVGKSTKSKGGLFKQIALNRAPTPVSSMES